MAYPAPIEALVDAFQRFPGIGRRSAERLTFHILAEPEARQLARAIDRAVAESLRCAVCLNLSESDPCDLCSDEARDRLRVDRPHLTPHGRIGQA